LSDQLQFGWGEDILLLEDFQFEPDNCGRHVGTFRKSLTAFITNKNGPLRGIRSWIGANSGTLTQKEVLMYEGREDMVTFLRVHNVPGMMDFTLFQPEVPLTWYNSFNMDGVTVDGNRDSINQEFSPWQLVTSEWGSYLRSYNWEQDIIPSSQIQHALKTFYLDNREPNSIMEDGTAVHPHNFHMCCSSYMNTTVAWGVSGFQLKSTDNRIPNTCPNRFKPWPKPLPDGMCKDGEEETLNHLKLSMRQLYLEAGLDPTVAAMQHDTLEAPLIVTVA